MSNNGLDELDTLSDAAWAAQIDRLYAETNPHETTPIAVQEWTPMMLIEMYVSSCINLHEEDGTPDGEGNATIAGVEMRLLFYAEGNAPPPLGAAQQYILDRTIADAKAKYWRGKQAGRLS